MVAVTQTLRNYTVLTLYGFVSVFRKKHYEAKPCCPVITKYACDMHSFITLCMYTCATCIKKQGFKCSTNIKTGYGTCKLSRGGTTRRN